MKTAPKIDHLEHTGTELIATIAGQKVHLPACRESLWRQSYVYLPEPFTDQCPTVQIFSDFKNEDSDLTEIDGVIFDREVAAWMGQFVAGKLKKGMLR